MKTSTFGNGELPYEIVSVSEAYARPLDQKSNQLRYMVVAEQKHKKKMYCCMERIKPRFASVTSLGEARYRPRDG